MVHNTYMYLIYPRFKVHHLFDRAISTMSESTTAETTTTYSTSGNESTPLNFFLWAAGSGLV